MDSKIDAVVFAKVISIICACLTFVFLGFILVYVYINVSIGGRVTQINFPHFSATDNILAFGDAQYNRQNHLFVINSAASSTTGTCGELLYGKNVRIQDTKNGKVASFSTSFSFRFTTPSNANVWDNPNTTKDGSAFAFTFLKSEGLAEMQDMVSWMGLTGACQAPVDTSNSGSKPIPVFGVIFDTDYNYNRAEPSNNYVGIASSWRAKTEWDSNTSTYIHNLCGNKTHCSYLSNGGSFTAWIEFNHVQTLEVWLANGSFPSVEKPVKSLIRIPKFEIPLGLGNNVYLSFWGSSDVNHVERHEVLSWSFFSSGIFGSTFPLQKLFDEPNARKWTGLIVGVMGTIAAIVVFRFFLWLVKPSSKYCGSTLSYSLGMTRVFSYKELRKATKNFHETQMLGSGGFGTVYRGCLEPCGSLVAVKRIKIESKNAEATFLAEVSSLSRIRHRNVVQLHGWCHEEGRLLLVYDYMPNGSLSDWLHEINPTYKVLSWNLRQSILEGVATAVEYLHQDCLQCVVHRDIKSSNVLLDADFRGRLGDFGLARLLDHQKGDKTTMAAGTLGYMAPELPYTGKATKESDIYSFGILALEVMCGQRPLDISAQESEDIVLLQRVWRAHEAGAILSMADPRLMQTSGSRSLNPKPCVPNSHTAVEGDGEDEEMMIKKLLHLGLYCCLPNPKSRPSMEDVHQILQQLGAKEYNVSMPPLPATKPLGLYSSLEFSQAASFSCGSETPP